MFVPVAVRLLACLSVRQPGLSHTAMAHQVSVEYPKLVATDMMIRAHETQRIKDQMNALFALHTQQPTQRILEACERDHYLIANEAVKFGLADRVEKKIPALSAL